MTSALLELYFDGQCAFCATEMRRLSEWDTNGRLAFVDIAQPGFDCEPLGVDMTALNLQLHGRTSAGHMLVGIDCMVAAYTLAGRGWLVLPLRVPGLRLLLSAMYRGFACHRYTFSRWLGYQSSPDCTDGICHIGNPFLSDSRPLDPQ